MNGYVGLARDAQGTQDNLNPQSSTFPILKRTNETLLIEEGPTVVKSNTVTDMAIWDNPNSTWDGTGTDDQWDSYNASGITVLHVTNPRNIFHERFAFTDLIDAASTGTQDTSAKTYTIDVDEELIIKQAYYNSGSGNNLSTGTLSVTSSDTSNFACSLSADAGNNYESVTLGTQHTFTNTGKELYIKITNPSPVSQFVTSDGYNLVTSDGKNFKVSTGTGVTSQAISKVECSYNL